MRWDPLTLGLAKIATVGALVTSGFGVFVKVRAKRRYQRLDVYKDAVTLLTSNGHVKQFLGEPIRLSGIDLGNKGSLISADYCKFAVPASGTISQGVMFLEAIPEPAGTDNVSDEKRFILKSVEFELEKPKGRIRLL